MERMNRYCQVNACTAIQPCARHMPAWERNKYRFYTTHSTDSRCVAIGKAVVRALCYLTLGLLPFIVWVGSKAWDRCYPVEAHSS